MEDAVSSAGSHLLYIDGYSSTKVLLGNGNHEDSAPFAAGGHRWAIRYYPDGDRTDSAGYLSLFLVLLDADPAEAEDVTAHYKFTLVDKHGDATVGSRDGAIGTFSRDSSSCGYSKFIRRADLEGGRSVYLGGGDRLTVMCEVRVLYDTGAEEDAATAAPRARTPVAPPPQPCGKCGAVGHGASQCDDGGGKEDGRPTPVCYACGKKGHFTRYCSKYPTSWAGPNSCATCGKPGHFAPNCPVFRMF